MSDRSRHSIDSTETSENFYKRLAFLSSEVNPDSQMAADLLFFFNLIDL